MSDAKSAPNTLRDQMQRNKFDILHLGCGEDYHDDAWNVDVEPGVDPDETMDLDAYPWGFSDESWDTIRAHHVFEHLSDMERALREAERILRPGGQLVLKLPVGVDAVADPDHSWGTSGTPWTWRTPAFYTGERHWDTDVGLSVASRDVRLWSLYGGVEKYWHHLKLALRERRQGQGEWMFNQPATCGEFTVVFEK